MFPPSSVPKNLHYPIWVEISGPFGMFADATSGSESYSYPIPPPTACRGMISSIEAVVGVDINIVAVGVCNMPIWTGYSYNSFTPLRKTNLVKNNLALQIRESVLVNPCFQILALLRNEPKLLQKHHTYCSANPAHMMQDLFMRRLRTNRCFRPVSIGRKEFLASYFGVPRTPIQSKYNTNLPSICVEMFDNFIVKPQFRQNVSIKNGILRYDDSIPIVVNNGILNFENPAYQQMLERTSGRLTA